MAPRFAFVNAGQTQPQEGDEVATRAIGPRNITRGTGARVANRRTNMGDVAGLSHPQRVIDEGNPTIREMTQNANPTMQMLASILETQTRLLEGIAHGGGLSHNVGNVGQSSSASNRGNVTLEQFQKLGPPTFHGTTNPMVAEAWLKQIQKILDAIGCSDELRVVFATFSLQGEADHWWEATARMLRRSLGTRPISWKAFVDAFYEKYFPRSVANQMEREFLDLVQGNKSVAEYENKFNALSRFIPTLVDTEEKKCRHFLEGLRPSIETLLNP